MCHCQLDSYALTPSQAIQSLFISDYALRHFNKACSGEDSSGRIFHFLIGAVQTIPIIGLIASLIEVAFVHLFGSAEGPQHPLRHFVSPPNQGQSQDLLPNPYGASTHGEEPYRHGHQPIQQPQGQPWQSLSIQDRPPLAQPHPGQFRRYREEPQSALRQIERPIVQVDDTVKDGVRLATWDKVKNFQLNPSTVANDLRDTILYDGGGVQKNAKDLLHTYDVLQVPTTMTYNHRWQKIRQTCKEFFVHHAAAINVGENYQRTPEDFNAYSNRNRQLDEDRYVADMGNIYYHILSAQLASGAEHVVWVPFGMGAFLRNLKQHDAAYNDPVKMQNLRNNLAMEYAAQFSRPEFDGLHLYMCLPRVDEESESNYQAFLSAFERVGSQIQRRITLHVNTDATMLVQDLANTHGSRKASLANAANRKLLGNHWHKDGAKRAVDEGLHRRSEYLAAASFALNGRSQDLKNRRPTELADTVEYYGGQVRRFVVQDDSSDGDDW